MSVKSPLSRASTSRDPYQLERLAEELATRELTHPDEDEDNAPNAHDLPVYIPLAHDNPHLTAPEFDVEGFLLSRSHTTSLRELRSELRDYLSTLKEELVKLINDDYEAFISLSTDLRGEGVRLGRLRYPLGHLKAQILVFKLFVCLGFHLHRIRSFRNQSKSCMSFKMLSRRNWKSVRY